MLTSRAWLIFSLVALMVTASFVLPIQVSAHLRTSSPTGLPHHASSAAANNLPEVSLESDSPRLNCQDPTHPLYVASVNELFIFCESSANVTVISPVTDGIVAVIPIGYGLTLGGWTYDSGKKEIFIADYNNSNGNTVSVISAASNSLVATIVVSQGPGELTYDGEVGEIFDTSGISNDITVISDSTNSVLATVPLGFVPSGLTYDSGNGELYIGDQFSNIVEVRSASSLDIITNITVGTMPGGILYDSTAAELFVPNFQDNSVSIVSDATNSVVGTVNVGTGPSGMTLDTGTAEVWVSNFWSSNLSVISVTSRSLVATIGTGLGYAGATTYVAAEHEMLLQCVRGPNGGGLNISVLNDSTFRFVGSISEPGGTNGIALDPSLAELFVPTYPDSVSVVSTQNDTVVDTIVVGILPPTYTITFVETGLPTGSTWQVDFVACEDCFSSGYVGTSENSTLEFWDWENGTDHYIISAAVLGFSPTTPFGAVTVRGANITVPVSFVPAFQTVFFEGGLDNTTAWSVTVQGTVTLSNGTLVPSFIETQNATPGSSSLRFELPNGTYSYSATASGYVQVNGHLNVNGSAPALVAITFNKPVPWWQGNAPEWALFATVAFLVAVIAGLVIVVRRRRRNREQPGANRDSNRGI